MTTPLPSPGMPVATANGLPDRSWFEWFSFLNRRALLPVVPSYTVAQLSAAPLTAAANPQGLAFVSNEAGGAVLAFSDGTNWRRSTDRAVIS